jgi:hypothetical protein
MSYPKIISREEMLLGMAKLNDKKIAWIIKTKERGLSSSEITFIQKNLLDPINISPNTTFLPQMLSDARCGKV